MRYYTRRLYQELQRPDAATDEFSRVRDQYQQYLGQIKRRLPKGARQFLAESLHDCKVIGHSRGEASLLVIHLDGSQCTGNFRGELSLRCDGVRDHSNLENTIGDWWVWDELRLLNSGDIELSALLY